MSSEKSHKLRAFLDTNVLVAAFITEGLCFEILKRASEGEFLGITSDFVINEFKEVFSREFGEAELKTPIKEILNIIKEALEIRNPDEIGMKVKGVCKRDPSDDNILAGSLASGAEFLVTGDLDLLELKVFSGIRILKPREFIIELEKAI